MGRTFLLVVDAHSKWLEVIPMTSTTSADTIFKSYGNCLLPIAMGCLFNCKLFQTMGHSLCLPNLKSL